MLETILESKRAELSRARRERPLAAILAGLEASDRDFEAALGGRRAGLIFEHKRRSPSAGDLRPGTDPVAVARAYAACADAISVLTDAPFFGGSLTDLRRIRAAVELPVLRKDFVLDPYQVVEARAAGADAVLLMLSVLDDDGFRDCTDAAQEYGMGVLAEVHDLPELERALRLDAPVIGINSRDLRTLDVDLERVVQLAPRLPADRLVVAESGICSREDLQALRGHVDAFLVGTSLMREPDLTAATRRLVFGEVKVCGLTRPEDARAAWKAGASWGGLVFATGSLRRLEVDDARAVRRAAPLRWAGVFVNETPQRIAEIARLLSLDAVQLHGDESPRAVAALSGALSCEVWKAERVRPGHALPTLAQTGADRLLLDGYREGVRGGGGARFDWRGVARHPDRARIVLAGGLNAGNVARADAAGAGMLDVSSGVEERPGIKCHAELTGFFDALRVQGRARS